MDPRQKWEKRHASGTLSRPSAFLQDVLGDLPSGRCLDIACGMGANAELMIRAGYRVDAIDWSVVALRRFKKRLIAHQLEAGLVAADLRNFRFPNQLYDVVLCFRFLERGLWRTMGGALRRGGVVALETATTSFLDHKPGFPREYCLMPGELLRGFADLKVERYHESHRTGLASLVARKA